MSGVHGVRGEVRLFLHNPETTLFDRPRDVTLVAPDGARRVARVTARSGGGKRVLGRIDGIDDREAALRAMGTKLVLPRSALPKPKRGEFYIVDLLGAEVRIGDRRVGTLTAVHPTAGDDVLEIDVGARDPAFVPLVARWVLGVDTPARVISLAEDALAEGDDAVEDDDEDAAE